MNTFKLTEAMGCDWLVCSLRPQRLLPRWVTSDVATLVPRVATSDDKFLVIKQFFSAEHGSYSCVIRA
jgi:hypothetical protein